MLLTHCSCQGGESDTLESLFEGAGFDEDMKTATVSVIRRLREEMSERRVWGLISMGSIVLLAENVYYSPRYVQFWATSDGSYTISTMLPETFEPWQGLSAQTDSEEVAIAMILQGMDLSGGWSGAHKPSIEEPDPEPGWRPPPCWEMPESPAEIMEVLGELELPSNVQILFGEYGVVTLTQGPPTFITINPPWNIDCWAPPDEAPWPNSTYESSFRSKEQALALIRSALQKWPREPGSPVH